ncbi:MAG TPA: hypothetical protein VGG94_05770 [Chthoniobacterales bacterium]|jgi:hypothetical protein
MKEIRYGRGLRLGVSMIAALLVLFTFVPGLAAQTPEETRDEAEQFAARPIPRELKIFAVLLLVSAAGAGLYLAFRAWRYSNLFDRQYVFPPAGEATLRLGGSRSGGCMATIDFATAPADPPAAITPQKPEETPPP